MAANFNYTTRIPSVQGTQVIQPSVGLPNPQNNIFITGNRITPVPSNGLPVLNPQAGFPFYEYYKTYALPTQFLNNALGMLSYFQSCGFTVGYGYSASINLLNASAVDITTYAADNIAVVYYLTSAPLIQPLVGTSITGTFDDTTAVVTGNFVTAATGSFTYMSVVYDSYIQLESSQFANIAVADDISVSFSNPDILVPDATKTEPFLMNLYQAIIASLIPQNVNSTTATPQVYFSFLPDTARSGLFGPTASTLTLSIPTVATATTVTFAIPSMNVSYIPLSALGNSSLTQATSLATGTIVSSQINGGSLIVTLSNVTGTFNDADVVSLKLDATQTYFVFQQALFASDNISLQQYALPYQVNTNSDITGQYSPAFNYIAALNLPQTAQDGQAIAFITFANLTIAQNLAPSTLPTSVNNYQYEPIYYPYVPIIGELPLTAAQMAAAFAMVVGSNVVPLNPQGGVVINGLPVKNDPSQYINVQIAGIADQVMQVGWNAIAVNSNSQAYVVNPITGQTTLPGLPTPDVEFFNTYVWQTLDYLRKGITAICQAIPPGQVRQTPKILSALKSNIISFMLTMQDNGMLLNVFENQALVTIVQDATNPLGIDISIPAQIVPGLQQVYYTINVFSSTINLLESA